MGEATITYYPDYPGDSTHDYATAAKDTWENDIIPTLEMDTTINVNIGQTVDDWVRQDFGNFLDWLNQEGLNNDTGVNHIYVVDSPFGGGSFAGGDQLKSTNDAYAYWNAGKGNLEGANFNLTIAVHEATHNMLDTSDCPGDNNDDNSDDHTCGEIRRTSGYDKVTVMIGGYINNELGDSCNGTTSISGSYEYIHEYASCAEENLEKYLDNNF